MNGAPPATPRITFIINPCAGQKTTEPQWRSAVSTYLDRHALKAEVYFTQAPRHATELAQKAVREGSTHVVCVGGDGTLNEVAQALIYTPTVLVIVPAGSGNGLARHLGIPFRMEAALAGLSNSPEKPLAIDTGRVNGRLFCNVMGFGFDADVSTHYSLLQRRGFLPYLATTFRAFRRRRRFKCRVETAHHHYNYDAFLVTIANSEQYGYGARIAPGASVCDSQLDLVAVSPLGFFRGISLAARLFRGRIRQSAGVAHLRLESFRIVRDYEGPVHTDGEVFHEGKTLEVDIQPQSLNVLLPPMRARAHERDVAANLAAT